MFQPSLLKIKRRPIVGCYNFRPGHVRRWLWTHVGLRIFPQRSKIGSGEGVDSACIVGAGGGQIRVSKVPATLRVRNIVDNFQIRYLAQSDCFIALKDHSGGWNHMCEPLWTTDSGDSWPGCACAQCLVAREGAAFEVWCVLASQQQQQADHSSSTAIPGVAASGRTQARLRRLSPSWHQSVRARAPEDQEWPGGSDNTSSDSDISLIYPVCKIFLGGSEIFVICLLCVPNALTVWNLRYDGFRMDSWMFKQPRDRQ